MSKPLLQDLVSADIGPAVPRRRPMLQDLVSADIGPAVPRHKPLLQDLILAAMLADPAVLPETLAVRFGTTKKSVQSRAGMWRKRKMLPPKAAPAAVQQVAIPDTRLDDALAAEEACGAFIAELADVLGLDDPQGVDMADVLAAVKGATAAEKACSAFIADLADALGYNNTEPFGMANVLADVKGEIASVEESDEFFFDLCDVLGFERLQPKNMADVLDAVKVQIAARTQYERIIAECEEIVAAYYGDPPDPINLVTHISEAISSVRESARDDAKMEMLYAELRQVDAALGPSFGLRSARIVQLRSEAAQNTQLRSELRDAHAELARAAHLTESDLEARMELWQTAARLAVQADQLRDQQQGVMACGVVLSVAEMRQIATLRDAEATALRVRALRGEP